MTKVRIVTIKDVNGKCLRREHYVLLKQLGIEILMYDLKSFPEGSKTEFGFELHGSLTDAVDLDELLELLRIMKVATNSKNIAILKTVEQLKLLIGIADDRL